MPVAKHIEITAESTDGFDAAVREGIKRASETVNNVEGAWVKDQKVVVANGNVVTYRVNMKVTFLLSD
jgi:flavin-binding protein dodecin